MRFWIRTIYSVPIFPNALKLFSIANNIYYHLRLSEAVFAIPTNKKLIQYDKTKIKISGPTAINVSMQYGAKRPVPVRLVIDFIRLEPVMRAENNVRFSRLPKRRRRYGKSCGQPLLEFDIECCCEAFLSFRGDLAA
ncbi:hypothetical protein QN224_21475 [Sinorhizobium sp. 8-89]|uniref:hypothetical protein n=1 Tax=Sinorhizobium sp. 7-81 TaxID=3049087 RepID=UPI0024C34132|nr:hypothetical protein [Sinorhizobium sp. 7-81]MDK1387990.1 hypothetical protein [Sinorhizobium sp. 7-81]